VVCFFSFTGHWLPFVAGELATAAGAFDVINFCNNAWAWSATYSQRLSLLASAQVYYSGRQVGGKIAAGSRVGGCLLSLLGAGEGRAASCKGQDTPGRWLHAELHREGGVAPLCRIQQATSVHYTCLGHANKHQAAMYRPHWILLKGLGQNLGAHLFCIV
jgi:hypothetical protein